MRIIESAIESVRANLGIALAALIVFALLVAFFALDPGNAFGRKPEKTIGPETETSRPSPIKKPRVVDLSDVGDDFSLVEEARFSFGTDTVVIHENPLENNDKQ